MDGPVEEIAEDEAGECRAVADHGDEHRPPADRRRTRGVERQRHAEADILGRLFRDLRCARPQPVYDRCKRRERCAERHDPPVEGKRHEHRSQRKGSDDRHQRRSADAQDLDRFGVQNGCDEAFAPPLFGIGEIKTPGVDVAHEVLLVPQRIAAFDDRDGPDAPVLLRLRNPLEGAGILTDWPRLAAAGVSAAARRSPRRECPPRRRRRRRWR